MEQQTTLSAPQTAIYLKTVPPSEDTLVRQKFGKNAKKVGKYYALETLGEGGFSKVKLGVVPSSNEKVALKILKKDKLQLSTSTRTQVEREINAMAKIQHPHVIRLKEVDWDAQYPKRNGQTESSILVVLELAQGGELFDFLSYTGSFDESIARTYFHQLISAVDYCHSQGVAHRDLKPENLLLDDKFALKLADFGFSNAFSGANLLYTECGTAGYMAPEMQSGAGYDAPAADIWSCGVILFIMLASFPPFQRPSMQDWWFNKLASGKPHLFWMAHERNAQFSPEAKDLITKILNPDPKQRISAAAIKAHPWLQVPPISDTDLFRELSRRKSDVDHGKAEERKQQGAMDDTTDEDTDGGLDDVVMRGHVGSEEDPNAENLPRFPPAMSRMAAVPAVRASDASGFDSSDAFGFSSSSVQDFEIEGLHSNTPSASLFDVAALGPACYTMLYTSLTPKQLNASITASLDALQASYSVDDHMRAKARLITAGGPVTLSSQVFAYPESATTSTPAPCSVVTFRRFNGDSIQFRQLFKFFGQQLRTVVVPAPEAAACTEIESQVEIEPGAA